MGLHRLTAITIGVHDVDTTAGFYRAFGLDERAPGRFHSRDGGEQLVLEPAPWRGLRRIGLGVDDPDDLDRIAASLAGLDVPVERTPGHLRCVEPLTGVVVEVVPAPRLTAPPPPAAPVNAPGEIRRVDVPAAGVRREGPVRPSHLSHLVLGTPDQPATLRFFTDGLGFEISDELSGVIAFTRCSDEHHNVAVQAAPGPLLHHVAWEVDDVDEVGRGGFHMVRADEDRHVWGLGRHAIGSNWFWYLKDPAGTFVEYTADLDRITDQDLYQPKAWSGHEFLWAYGPPPPPEFLEPADAAEIFAAQATG
jgi:catechol 2,3-dioxygenase-like lactoylglutathione lyase family enzyme